MSAQRAFRLARTLAGAGVLALICDRDFIFNSLDLITIGLLVTAAALLAYAKDRT